MKKNDQIGADLLRQQAELRQSGLLAEADHLWLSPCRTFALAGIAPDRRRRPRLTLGGESQKR